MARIVDVMAGDGRFRYCYARKGAAKELRRRPRELVGEHAWVRSRAEVLDDGWIGTGATGTFPAASATSCSRSRDASAFIDPALPIEVRLRSAHGSLTADEMYVPLVAAAAG